MAKNQVVGQNWSRYFRNARVPNVIEQTREGFRLSEESLPNITELTVFIRENISNVSNFLNQIINVDCTQCDDRLREIVSEEISKISLTSSIPNWSRSTTYLPNQVVLYRGVQFRSKEVVTPFVPTSFAAPTPDNEAFADSLSKWDIISDGTVKYQPNHNFEEKDAVFWNPDSNAYEKALADDEETTGTHIVISSDKSGNNEYFAAVSTGLIHWPAHGLPAGFNFVSMDVAGSLTEINPEETGGVSNPLVLGVDSDRFMVLHYRPSNLVI